MNIYEKIQKIKVELLKCDMKKSGDNKFGGFRYFDLGDIMPAILELCEKYKLFTNVSFTETEGILTVIDTDKPEQKIEVKIPIEKFENSKMNKIQIIGWVTTYIRRYLYLTLFDIIESDTFDAAIGKPEVKKTESKKYCCENCSTEFKPFTDLEKNKWCSAKDAYEQVKKKYGKAICKICREKTKGAEMK